MGGRPVRPVRRVGAFLLATCLAMAAHASEDPRRLILQTLSTRDGLPQGTVMAALQDSQGFMWLGTEDGLVRFDGHDLHRYAYSSDRPDGLPGNFINAIVEDKHGDLWIGIKGSGLAHWRRDSDSFTTYRHDPARADTLASDAVRTLLVDTRGHIWIGTLDAGLDVLDPATGRIRHFRNDPEQAGSLLHNQVQSLLQDREGRIWIGTHAGLNRWMPENGRFVAYGRSTETAVSLNGLHISQVIEDGSGSLWIATFDAGLYQMDPSGKVITGYRHDPARSSSLISNDVRTVLDDQAGHLWAGTAEGLELLDRKSGQFTHYGADRSDPDSLGDSFIMSLYRDPGGLVWIGMRSGGVSRWNPHSWELGNHRPAWVEGKLITSFADSAAGKIWVGSLGGGLVDFDPQTGESRTIDAIVHRRNALDDQRVMSLLQDRSGSLWIGTMASGLKKLSQGRIESIPVRVGDPHSLSAAGIMSLYEARDGRLWIGTHGGGANIMESHTGLVRQLPYGKGVGAFSAPNVTSFAEDLAGNLWIGTDGGGVNVARPDGTVIAVFRHAPNDPNSLSANTVYSVTVDQAGGVWIATDGAGLNQVVGSSSDPKTVTFRKFSHANGLSSDTIYGVLADAKGSLWMSGNAGLMRMSPHSGSVKTYHREDGLQGEEFNFGAFFRTREGLLCFGGPGGFNVFNPAQLSERDAPPRLALMRLEVLGAPLRSAKPYWLLDQVDLDYRDNIVSFDFAALDFASPNRNQLAYRMAGLTERWINLGSQRRVTLTNLAAGNHMLEVRAVNGDSVSSRPLHLSIHKRAAPWRSPGAYAAYALAAIALIVLLLRAQRLKLSNALAAQQRLESQVESRTHELSESNRQLAAASEAKSHFLARMSHELRTPMNGIVGMAELLARSQLSTAQVRQTQTIRTSAQTLLRILNDLLDLSKAQAGKVQLEILPLDLTQILEECAALFAGAADAKGLDLIVCPPVERGCALLGDPLRLRQVLMNLIGNAIKFTERGEVVISCDLTRNAGGAVLVDLSVRDTGIGLSQEAIARIFEPFTQADETMTRRFGGTGLGLSICRELVGLMGGAITVESTPGIGSLFRVSLSLEETSQAAPHRVTSIDNARALILTPHLALGEALRRYCSQLGMRCARSELDTAANTSSAVDLVLIDGDRYSSVLAEYLPPRNLRPVVIVATPSLAEQEPLRGMRDTRLIVRKPIASQALQEALEAALAWPQQRWRATRAGSRASIEPRGLAF